MLTNISGVLLDLKTPKFPFEINWPLESAAITDGVTKGLFKDLILIPVLDSVKGPQFCPRTWDNPKMISRNEIFMLLPEFRTT